MKADEYSPFRWHLRTIKSRTNRKNKKAKPKECNLTLQDLKDQWESQKGICPHTNWPLKNMATSSPEDQLPKTPDRASLDRIDSSKGYVKGNVQFIALIAQLAKNNWEEKVLYEFAESIKKAHP